MLSVVALGVFMGNYMFKLMEGKSSQSNSQNNKSSEPSAQNADQGTVKILYGDKGTSSKNNDNDFQQNKNSATPDNAVPVKTQIDASSSEKTVLASSTATDTAKPVNDMLAFSPTGPRWHAFASTNGLNVRETPDKKGKFLFKVAKGTRGVVKEKKDGWTYIQWDFNKKKGWSIDEYLIQGPANIVDDMVNNKKPGDKAETIKPEQITQANIEKEVEQSKTIIGVARPASTTETVISYTNGKELPKKGTITAQNGANIREGPTTQSNRLIKLPKGTTVGIKSVKQVDKYQWFEITYSNDTKTGWTREDNLKF